MTDVPVGYGRENLGVGGIVADTFSILFRRIGHIFILAFLPALFVVIVQYQLTPPVDLENRPDLSQQRYSLTGRLLSELVAMIGTSLITALIVRLAYDSKTGNPMRPMAYVSSVFTVIVPLVICSIAVSIAASVATLALIVPGLWVYAVWSCVTPAIVIEAAGFGSFERSADLTRNYRWPCVGVLLVVTLCAFVPLLAINSLYIFDIANSALAQGSVYILVKTAGMVVFMAASGISIALIYARLREIKEGTSVEQLADVFA